MKWYNRFPGNWARMLRGKMAVSSGESSVCKLECASVSSHYQACGMTHVGRVRRQNQDSYYMDAEQGIFVVADGMGGHKAGDVASRTIVETLPGLILDSLPASNQENSQDFTQKVLQESVGRVNKKIFDLSLADRNFEGMGSTLVMALERNGTVYLAHVGDSRAYVVRNGMLRQATWDHSLVAELVKWGELSEEDAWRHPRRHIITRAIGTTEEVEADLAHYNALSGDILLLCTDGLSDMVWQDRIMKIVLSGKGPDSFVPELITEALAAGGRDNITVVAVMWL